MVIKALILALAAAASGTFTNPIIHADYSDPDVVCVDGEYWMTASSFNCVPGLQILHSYDLVNWEICGAALPRLDYDKTSDFDSPKHGKGVYAPSIRYHDGRFYIFWGDPDSGIYQVSAEDPKGQWSKPVLVVPGKGLIDPCPLWDDDGRVYLVHGWAGSRVGFNSVLSVCELSRDCSRCISEQILVFDGNRNGNKTVEGPKFYKRNGFYYIFAPAGGVKKGWQLVLRSENIYGPYEYRKVLHQGSTTISGPHQGGWVEDAAGKCWFMHFHDAGIWGRVTYLEPMQWQNDGWCTIGVDLDGDGIGEPVDVAERPQPFVDKAVSGIPAAETGTGFTVPVIPANWQWHANPQLDWAMPVPSESSLRLNCVTQPEGWVNLWHTPNLLLEKISGPEMELTATLSFRPGYEGDRAGMVVMGYDYSTIELNYDGAEVNIVRRSCSGANKVGQEVIEASSPFVADEGLKGSITRLGHSIQNMIYANQTSRAAAAKARKQQEDAARNDFSDKFYTVSFKITIDKSGKCFFSYSYDGMRFKPVGDPFMAKPGSWIGTKVGFFAIAATQKSHGGYVGIR